jgi:hypothetical protein
MAYDSLDPTDGHPVFDDAGALDSAVDPTQVAEYAAEVGTRLMGTAAQRVAYSYARKGLSWQDTDSGEFLWKHDGTDWKTDRASTRRQFVGSTSGTGVVTVNHLLPGTPSGVSVLDSNSGAVPATRKIMHSASSTSQIQFVVYNNGAPLPNNPVVFYWEAFL